MAAALGGFSAAGGGFSTRIITSPDLDIAEDRFVTATGSYSATASHNGSAAWVTQVGTLRAATWRLHRALAGEIDASQRDDRSRSAINGGDVRPFRSHLAVSVLKRKKISARVQRSESSNHRNLRTYATFLSGGRKVLSDDGSNMVHFGRGGFGIMVRCRRCV
jgi:hypothetical protein